MKSFEYEHNEQNTSKSFNFVNEKIFDYTVNNGLDGIKRDIKGM